MTLGRFLCSTEKFNSDTIQHSSGLYLYWMEEEKARKLALDWFNIETKKRIVAHTEEAARILLAKFNIRDETLVSSAELQLFDLWNIQNKMIEAKSAVCPLTYLAALGAPIWSAGGVFHTTLDAETIVTEPRTLENLMGNFEYIRSRNDTALAERVAEALRKMDLG